ncbi:exonuclease domain-containing protein [Streptomyces sp. NPDC006259]|uniref:exonuclease domain-containing protein n=1 Tax=Streptomyces sp. NPDC006259 TaxID=3364740 RepID=UPI00368808D1
MGGDVLLDVLIDPRVPIPAESTAIHGITNQMTMGAPSFADVLPRLEEVLEGGAVPDLQQALRRRSAAARADAALPRPGGAGRGPAGGGDGHHVRGAAGAGGGAGAEAGCGLACRREVRGRDAAVLRVVRRLVRLLGQLRVAAPGRRGPSSTVGLPGRSGPPERHGESRGFTFSEGRSQANSQGIVHNGSGAGPGLSVRSEPALSPAARRRRTTAGGPQDGV